MMTEFMPCGLHQNTTVTIPLDKAPPRGVKLNPFSMVIVRHVGVLTTIKVTVISTRNL